MMMPQMPTMINNFWLYSWVELFRKNKDFLNYYINYYTYWRDHQPEHLKDNLVNRNIDAMIGLMERVAKEYKKPEFGIKEVKINNRSYPVTEQIIKEKPFCRLLHFKKNYKAKSLPKLLIVAPMSGHFSTLLRGTVTDCLSKFDVYITDWNDAKNVPLSEGKFDLNTNIDYTMEFIKELGPNLSVMAVCQPVVPVLAAVSLLEQNGETPVDNMILMGGPVDARLNSTEVNKLAESKSICWFEKNLITNVPINYKGFMRPVYPGFMQLSGFMAMNMRRHISQFINFYHHLVEGDGDSAETHRKFYDEYLSVMDITAEFYLQTVETVFQNFDLPKGNFYHHGQKVEPEKISNSALLIIEGEKDDISGIGQTKAAIDLCKNIPKDRTKYHMQPNVGHYGVFNGSRFRNEIVPVIDEFCNKHLLNKN